jgi:hypothetical protein
MYQIKQLEKILSKKSAHKKEAYNGIGKILLPYPSMPLYSI